MAYSLTTSYTGESLLSGFNWFNGRDPNHGFVAYQSQEDAESLGLYSIQESTGSVRLGVDSSRTYAPGQGRPSIRLESKQAYNEGLFIADFLHMPPSKCGLWPAFWAYGSDWPNNGEIDIIEGANLNTRNLMSAHTRAGCSQLHPQPQAQAPAQAQFKAQQLVSAASSLARFTGRLRTAQCFIGTDNTGCGYDPPPDDTTSYGDGFNAVGGGVYAMQWDAESIKVWHFERGRIPPDVDQKRPRPEGWGVPQAVFGGEACDTRSYWRNMNLVLNINFCGDFGGGVWPASECRNLAPTCEQYVGMNPSEFADAYWDVRYIDVYQENLAYAPPSPPPAPPRSVQASSAPESSGDHSSVPVPSSTQVRTSRPTSTSISTPVMTPVSTPTSSTLSRPVSRLVSRPSDPEPSDTEVVVTRTVTVIPEQSIGGGSRHPATTSSHSSTTTTTTPIFGGTNLLANSTHPDTTRSATNIISRPTVTLSHRPFRSLTAASTSYVTVPSSSPTSQGLFYSPPSDHCDEDKGPPLLGCFKPTGAPPHDGLEHVRTASDMSASKCTEICADRDMKYAGVFATSCFCSFELSKNMLPLNHQDCNEACPGNPAQECGGTLPDGLLVVSVYGLKPKDEDSSEDTGSVEDSRTQRPDDDDGSSTRINSSSTTATGTRESNANTQPRPLTLSTSEVRDYCAGRKDNSRDGLSADAETTLAWSPTLVQTDTSDMVTGVPQTREPRRTHTTTTTTTTGLGLGPTLYGFNPALSNGFHSGARRGAAKTWMAVGFVLAAMMLPHAA